MAQLYFVAFDPISFMTSVVTMLDKPEGRVVVMEPKYIGFTIPKAFVVGYGLDYDEYYRNLPYVGILKEEVYMN